VYISIIQEHNFTLGETLCPRLLFGALRDAQILQLACFELVNPSMNMQGLSRLPRVGDRAALGEISDLRFDVLVYNSRQRI
jgi:hypothetical protein